MKRFLVPAMLAGMLSFGVAAPAAAGGPGGGNQAGDTLVNVQISDIVVQVPIAVAANLCDINVNILAAQAREGGATCEATAESMASPGPGHGHGPHDGNQAGDSLVNVQISDVTIQVPVGLAANLCDVNANVLALQLRQGGAECTATAESIAS